MSDETRLGWQPFLDGHYDASIQLQINVYRRQEAYVDRWERHKDGLATPEQVRDWQTRVRAAALEAVGGLPPGDSPLEPEIVGTIAADGYEIDRLIFQSLPGAFVTANLYRPRRLAGPTGAVLFVCGHAELAKAYPHYQAVCHRLARNGLVALAMDPIGQGERRSYLAPDGTQLVRWGVPEHTYAGVQCWWLGQSNARYFVHDIRRAIDYLVGRPEVDPARIGITGNSGGGTQSTWAMLLEPRLAAAAPGTFVMDRRSYMWSGQGQDAEQIILNGTANGIDHEDFIIAMAPRPVLIVAVDYDFFPIEATARTVARARRVYELFGKGDRVGLARDLCTHEYSPPLARAATEFFVQYLRGGDPAAVDHADPTLLDASELSCTRSGQILLDRPQTRRTFDLNHEEFDRLRETRPAGRARAAAADGARTAADWLRARVEKDRRPAEPYPRWLPGPTLDSVALHHVYWWSEVDILGAGVVLRPTDRDWESLTIALYDRGSLELDEPARRGQVLGWVRAGRAVFVLDVRGLGALAFHRLNSRPDGEYYATDYKLLTDLMTIGDSVGAGRIFDVLRAVRLARTDPELGLGGRPIRLYGAGRGGFVGYLAAALESAIGRVELEDEPLDLDALLTTRYYPAGPTWHNLIPGLAAVGNPPDLAPLFEGRELAVPVAAGR